MIDHDRDAYMAAAQGEAAVDDFFFSRMVLSEGSQVRCKDARKGMEVRHAWGCMQMSSNARLDVLLFFCGGGGGQRQLAVKTVQAAKLAAPPVRI